MNSEADVELHSDGKLVGIVRCCKSTESSLQPLQAIPSKQCHSSIEKSTHRGCGRLDLKVIGAVSERLPN